MRRRTVLTILALAGVSACAWGYDEHYYSGGWTAEAAPGPAYRGRQWAAPRAVRTPFEGALTGPGLAQLDDWLKDTPEGRAITLGFGDAANGVISEETADRANIWFRHYADTNHDMTITDPEIRTALVAASRRYLARH
jgi:hypothetical protein